jgi:hypothetical protein
MTGATLCVSCAALPTKDRGLAIKTMQCPDCKTDFGITSYGAAFRIQTGKRKRFLSPALFTGMMLGAGLFTFVMALTGLGLWSKEKIAGPDSAPAALPAPNELARVPQVAVDDPFPHGIQPAIGKQRIEQLIAKIRLANANPENKDAFLLAQMAERKELRGMPFVMGDACRLNGGKAQLFQTSVLAVRDGMESEFRSARHDQGHGQEHVPFWDTYLAKTAGQGIDTDHGVAALSQILAPERPTLRTGLVQRLALSNSPEATRTLARAAIFDVSGEVRTAAIKALKTRPPEESSAILMHGIRYPLPVIAKRTAQAMLALARKDLLPQLVSFLDEPAPGDPVETNVNEEQVCVVREIVRINHHRNCLLCHPPSASGSTHEVPGVIPIPGRSFAPSPKEAYGSAQSQGEPMVRADTTYLRQDFSLMMPVENAAPWPEMQRFDFLVRTRTVEGKELTALQQKVQARPADFQSENHKAAVRVLRELTGQDAAPNQAAWQRVLGLAKADE